MKHMNICRICLSKKPEKDIMLSEVEGKPFSEIMMFCLDVKIEEDSKITTKMCLKCVKKLLSFHEFKSLALQNDVYLKSLDVKNEIFIEVEKVVVKEERLTISSNNDTKIKVVVVLFFKNIDLIKSSAEFLTPVLLSRLRPEPVEPITELSLNVDDHDTGCNLESDDELLSVTKNIKYETIEDKIKSNDQTPKIQKTKKKNVKLKNDNVKQMCEECGKTVSDLKSHSLLHLPKSERKRYHCQVCGKMFANYNSRYIHNKIKHLGLKKTCEICNKAVGNLNVHKRMVHDKESLPFECVECGKRFIAKSALELHMRKHTEDRPFHCDVCDKKCISNQQLQRHKRRIHDKEKSHLCQLCSKSFFMISHLKDHLRSHSQEKPFECPDCDKCFKTSANLKSHRETHGDNKNFSCELCTQKFMRKKYLWKHMKSHTKDKRFSCSYCDVRFHRSDHRRRHEYTAHQKHLISSPEQQAKFNMISSKEENIT